MATASTSGAKPSAVSDGPANPKHLKEAKLLLKGVAKFLRYNDDLISADNKAKIAGHEADFRAAMEKPGVAVKELEELAGTLTKVCEKSVPGYQASAIRENIEVIFVAVVIAMGIRAYFAQPFKIPTGSMQPTLNGVIGHPDASINPDHEYKTDEDRPGFAKRVWDKIWYGRTWVDELAEGDEVVHIHPISDQRGQIIGGFREVTILKFFTYTYIPIGVDPLNPDRIIKIPGTSAKVRDLLNPALLSNARVKKGDVIARGFVDTGDQVIVDKFSYHWVRPERGEVFVFTTNDIPYIQAGIDRRMGSQHYIKRLGGIPGDHLEIKDKQLFVNGQLATEPGFVRVMSRENGYRGYQASGNTEFELGAEQYVALGDNSENSSDSRVWGHVPARNIVGRALFVYLPFGHHFGVIR